MKGHLNVILKQSIYWGSLSDQSYDVYFEHSYIVRPTPKKQKTIKAGKQNHSSKHFFLSFLGWKCWKMKANPAETEIFFHLLK